MEKQEKLIYINEEQELYMGKKPKITIVRNNYMSAGALIREEIVKKLWIVPTK